MRRVIRAGIVTCIIVILVALAALIGYATYLRGHPARLKAAVGHQLSEQLGLEATLGEARLAFLRGSLELDDVRLVHPAGGTLDLRQVRVRFAPWWLLLGKVHLRRVVLIGPRGVMPLEALSQGHTPRRRPPLEVHEGSLRVLYRGQTLALEGLEGTLGPRGGALKATCLGGRLSLEVHTDGERIRGTLKGEGLMLERLGPSLDGRADFDLAWNPVSGHTAFGLELSTEGLKLPGLAVSLDAALNLGGTLEQGRLTLDAIGLQLPFTALEGTAELDLALGRPFKDALLSLALFSNDFDYETAIGYVSREALPPLVAHLLHDQIRGGASRLSHLRYTGTLGDLLQKERLIPALSLRLAIQGQSLGACRGPERVSEVRGSVLLEGGRLAFQGLTGRLGEETIEQVNVVFDDIAHPGVRLGVDVKLELSLQAFVEAWRAVMITPGLHAVLDPVSRVQDGLIRGQVTAVWDSRTGEPLKARGWLRLTDAAFEWNTLPCARLAAEALSDQFEAPLQVHARGLMAGMQVEALDVSMEQPFGRRSYTFALEGGELPQWGGAGLSGDTRMSLKGTGVGWAVQGTLGLTSRGFDFRGTSYRTDRGLLRGKGEFRGALRPTLALQAQGQLSHPACEGMTFRLAYGGARPELSLEGALEGKHLVALTPEGPQPLKGGVSGDVRFTLGQPVGMFGTLRLERARLYLKGRPVVLEGVVRLEGETLATEALDVSWSTLSLGFAGRFTLGDPLVYRGTLAIDGLKLGEGGGAAPAFLRDLEAQGGLSLTRLDLYGLPIDTARAQAELKGGILRLSDMQLEGLSGTIAGSSVINLTQGARFDVALSLMNMDIERFFGFLAQEGDGGIGLDGTMFLTGRLWGSTASLNGDLVFASMKGHLRRYSILSKIFSVLNLYKLVTEREIDLIERGYPYNYISSTLKLRDNTLMFDDFRLDSNSVQLSAVGEYSLASGSIDAVVGIQPLETVDRALNLIPLVGWVLTGDDGRLLVISVKVKGTVDDLSIVPAPLDTLSKPIAGAVLRVLRLPLDLLKRPRDVIVPGNGSHKRN